MKKLSVEEKYYQLKSQTEAAGMSVKEINGKLVVRKKKTTNEKPKRKTN